MSAHERLQGRRLSAAHEAIEQLSIVQVSAVRQQGTAEVADELAHRVGRHRASLKRAGPSTVVLPAGADFIHDFVPTGQNYNDNSDKDLRHDAATNACVKAASRPSPCVKFWSGNKVVMKAFPEVKGRVMGYYPFKKVYHLLLADSQVPQALQARLYSPAGMPGQARIEVAAEEIVLCDTEKSG
jgi:hypothetical protein